MGGQKPGLLKEGEAGREQAVSDTLASAHSLANCAREPIHIPGSIQPHGVLLLLDAAELTLVQASKNTAELLGLPVASLLGKPLGWLLAQLLPGALAQTLEAEVKGVGAQAAEHLQPMLLRSLDVAVQGQTRTFHVLAHCTSAGLILELELGEEGTAALELHPLLDSFTLRAEKMATLTDLSQLAVTEVQRLTGFDRVLIYRFDDQWNGIVIGEDGNGRLPSLLNHRFPASDIPAQARELYRVNRLRIIPDASYRPVPLEPTLNPVSGQPLDLSFSTLRSVSPVHVEYMRNMETASSMSVSILRDGRLWGLISCHHREPRRVRFQVRRLCDLFGRVFSLRLAALEHTQDYERRIEVQSAYAKLVFGMADHRDFVTALAEHGRRLVSFADAEGAAVLIDGGCRLLGKTPDEAEVRELAQWMFSTSQQEVYSTESLPAVYAAAQAYKDRACGLLAIAVSKLHPSYVMWFRPEVIQTLKWSGDPHKPVSGSGEHAVLHPRRSFATWLETVRERSLPWKQSELDGAAELRNTIVGTVLRKAEELAALNAELTRSNKELEAFSYSVSHDLRAPLRHIASYAAILKEGGPDKLSAKELRYLNTIISSSDYAGQLVDKLLGFSRLGRAELQRSRVNMKTLVLEVKKEVMEDKTAKAPRVTWKVGELPTEQVDLMMMRLAIRDLLSNAVKYTRKKEEAIIEVGFRDEEMEHVFFVKDNGVGFDMDYAGKLFGVFQRLHRWEEYEGTGIGLANVRRVVERHGGRTWAEGKEGLGATIYFALPKTGVSA